MVTSTRRAGAVVVCCVAAALLVGGCGGAGDAPATAAGGPPTACPVGPGSPIAGIRPASLPCLTRDGAAVQVSAVHGRPEVINIWASWCGPCKQEIPLLQRMHVLAGSSVLFLGVDVRDKQAHALSFLHDQGATYPQAFDSTGSFPISLRMYGVPDTLVVDGTGHIVYRVAGPITEAELRSALTKAGVALPS